MTDSDCRGDLPARQRRGLSSAAELALAEKHIAGCASCQLARDLGASFDDEGAPEVGDELLIACYAKLGAETAQSLSRSTAAATPVRAAHSLRQRAPRIALYAAAAVVLLAAAAAATSWLHVWAPRPAPGERTATTEVARAPERPPIGPLHAPPKPEPAALLAQPEHDAPAAGASEQGINAAARSPSAESASTLFARANEARRSGDRARAIALYERLQRAFPESAESQLSQVTQGRLLLDNGSAAAALVQFDRYLARPGGRLALEALVGRARALGALSRANEERETWKRVLNEFPGSVYAEKARKRLGELQ